MHHPSKFLDDLVNARQLSGGDINDTWLATTTSKDVVIKINAGDKVDMFKKESLGLQLLAASNSFKIPLVYWVKQQGTTSAICMEYISPAQKSASFWEDFGEQLAALHRHTSEMYGLDHDNYIGELPQSNSKHKSWQEFFANERILPMMKLAMDNGRLEKQDLRRVESILSRLNNLLPKESPALLHGDLWSGNFLVSESGDPVLIDPAVYYGHREMDLGMMKLFGGFNDKLFAGYHEFFPLENNWNDRVLLCQLYPLLVHVNLFGGGYAGSVRACLKAYS